MTDFAAARRAGRSRPLSVSLNRARRLGPDVPQYQPSVSLVEALLQFVDGQPGQGSSDIHIRANPYRRPVSVSAIRELQWDEPLTADRLVSQESLITNRILMNLYESDALFLPADGLAPLQDDFDAFYCPNRRAMGEVGRIALERHAFGFLDKAVDVSGNWDAEAVAAHLDVTLARDRKGDSTVLGAIEKSSTPEIDASSFIVQMALDGLSEATAMSQNLGGSFGGEQSALFRVFIDEFGYGVPEAKHSALFSALCESIGISADPHYFWHFYLPTSIAVNNYFYYVTRNHRNFFRYVGAVTYIEAMFASAFASMGRTFRKVFGDTVDTRYCDEHAHIDRHHERMTRNDLLLSFARRNGVAVGRDLVRGVEDIRLLLKAADHDLEGQLRWSPRARPAGERELVVAGGYELTTLTPFETRVADAATTVVVTEGRARVSRTGVGSELEVGKGWAVDIPAQRLWGVSAERARIQVWDSNGPA